MNIDHINLSRIDLNLLVALDALLTERSVTRAAARVGLGQSAMSHNLGRLRTGCVDAGTFRPRRIPIELSFFHGDRDAPSA